MSHFFFNQKNSHFWMKTHSYLQWWKLTFFEISVQKNTFLEKVVHIINGENEVIFMFFRKIDFLFENSSIFTMVKIDFFWIFYQKNTFFGKSLSYYQWWKWSNFHVFLKKVIFCSKTHPYLQWWKLTFFEISVQKNTFLEKVVHIINGENEVIFMFFRKNRFFVWKFIHIYNGENWLFLNFYRKNTFFWKKSFILSMVKMNYFSWKRCLEARSTIIYWYRDFRNVHVVILTENISFSYFSKTMFRSS